MDDHFLRQHAFRPTATVIDLAVLCVDYTNSLDQCRQLPFILGRTLNIDCVGLGIFAELASFASAPNPIFCAAFGQHPDFGGGLATSSLLQRVDEEVSLLLNSPKRSASQFQARQYGQQLEETSLCGYKGQSRVMAHVCAINHNHRMLLFFLKRFGNLGITAEMFASASILAIELSKQLRNAIACESPLNLGPPFDLLTVQEFRVMVELRSELSEKEVATKLNMSYHTLHSNIKSIYKKLGVQGRLHLWLRLNAALRKARISAHTSLVEV